MVNYMLPEGFKCSALFPSVYITYPNLPGSNSSVFPEPGTVLHAVLPAVHI